MNSTPQKKIEQTKQVLQDNVSDQTSLAELNQFLAAFEKRMQKEAYDKEIYKSGRSKFLTKYQKELYAANLDTFLKKSATLSDGKSSIMKLIGAPDDLANRAQYLEKVLPTVPLEWCKKIMQNNLEADKIQMATIAKKLKEKSKLDTASIIGENIINLENDVNLFVANHKNIEALIQSIKTKNKGKAVILDVWATWCAPCISDMRESKDIKKELKKLPVEVVYLCVESNSSLDKWKNKTAELAVSGDHIFLNKELSAEILDAFKLTGYPSYIFIDQEGNYDSKLIARISNIDLESLKEKL